MTSLEKRKEKRYQKRKQRRMQKKQQNLTLESVFSPDNMWDSETKCYSGTDWKSSVIQHEYNRLSNAIEESEQLVSGELIHLGFHNFDTVERGVLRHISSLKITERIIHNCLCTNALYPEIEKTIVFDNCASIKHAGISRSLTQLKKHLHRYYREVGSNDGYIVLLDCRHYFDSIKHSVAISILNKLLIFADPSLRKLISFYISAFSEITDSDCGLGFGSPLSQAVGVLLLSTVDHYVKEQLHNIEHGSGRFMDDSYVIVQMKEDGYTVIESINELYNMLGLTLNISKTKIVPIGKPFIWLKKIVYLKPTGRVIMAIQPKAFRRERARLRKYKKLFEEGRATETYARQQFIAFCRQYTKFHSRDLIFRLVNYYNELFPQFEIIEMKQIFKTKHDKLQNLSFCLSHQYKHYIVLICNHGIVSARGRNTEWLLHTVKSAKSKKYSDGAIRAYTGLESAPRRANVLVFNANGVLVQH